MRCPTERVPTRGRGLDGGRKSWSLSHSHFRQPPRPGPREEEFKRDRPAVRAACAALRREGRFRSSGIPRAVPLSANPSREPCEFFRLQNDISMRRARSHFETRCQAFHVRPPTAGKRATLSHPGTRIAPAGRSGPRLPTPSLRKARAGSRRRTYRTLLRTVGRREAAGPQAEHASLPRPGHLV